MLENDIVDESVGIHLLQEALEKLLNIPVDKLPPSEVVFQADFGPLLLKAKAALHDFSTTGCKCFLSLAWTCFYEVYAQLYRSQEFRDVSFNLSDTSPNVARKVNWDLTVPGEYE